MHHKITTWAVSGLAVIGFGCLIVSLIYGFAAAPHYGKVLSDSIKFAGGAIVVFSTCISISNWKLRWLILLPIGIALANIFQAASRLSIIAGG